MDMYKIINGTPYNTDTSELLGSTTITEEDGDYEDEYYQELYQKKNGDFFVAHDGAEAEITCYGCYGVGYNCSYGIIPLSFKEAMSWVEDNLCNDDFENIFGKVTDDDTRTHICIAVSTEMNDAIVSYAKDNNMTKDDAYNHFLSQAIAKHTDTDIN